MKFIKTIGIIFVLLAVFSFVFSCSSDFDGDSNSVDSEKSDLALDLNSNPFSSLTMSCLGDSITMATKVDRPYPTVVKNILGLKEVNNYGVSWSNVAYIEDCFCHPDSDYNHNPYVFRYDEVEDADIIGVMGGVNDWGCLIPVGNINDTDPTTFYGALNTLIVGLKTDHPDSYIFFMTGFDYYDVDAYNRDKVYWREFNEAIVLACEKHSIDCFDVFNEIPIDRDVDMIDGIHPTQTFIDTKWAPAIADFIRENYKK